MNDVILIKNLPPKSNKTTTLTLLLTTTNFTNFVTALQKNQVNGFTDTSASVDYEAVPKTTTEIVVNVEHRNGAILKSYITYKTGITKFLSVLEFIVAIKAFFDGAELTIKVSAVTYRRLEMLAEKQKSTPMIVAQALLDNYVDREFQR